MLAEHFWREAAARVGSRATLGAATIAALARYDWPGNVRELQNVLAALAVRSPRRGVVPPSALPAPFAVARPAPPRGSTRRGARSRSGSCAPRWCGPAAIADAPPPSWA